NGKGDDWAALFNGLPSKTPCNSDGFVFIHDDVGAADPTFWQGGGSKDAFDPSGSPTGPWLWGPTNVAPDKNDINNAMAAIYHLPDPADGSTARFLFFGADRFAQNGDAQMGFWFLQANACLQGSSTQPAPAQNGCPSSTPNPPTGPCTPAFTTSN